MRGRGLKLARVTTFAHADIVAPHAGAWIETLFSNYDCRSGPVAPHAGAWIETVKLGVITPAQAVAPHAGAWIETRGEPGGAQYRRRPPCGGVD